MACGLCHLALLKQLDDVEYTGKCTPKYCPLKAYDHVHGCVETIPCTGEYRAYRNNMTKTNAIACLKKAKAVRDWRIATHIYREG
jgi:hypothetical protein